MNQNQFGASKFRRFCKDPITCQSGRRARHYNREYGFTLIELLVVVALMVIGTTFFLNLGGWTCTSNVRNDFDNFNSFLQNLRIQAMSLNHTTQAEHEKTSGQVHPNVWTQIRERQNCEEGDKWGHIPLGESLSSEAYLHEYDLVLKKANFADTEGFKVCFYPDGTATAATISVKAMCAGKIVHYKTQIFGATGFLETTKLNAKTGLWDEL